MPAPSKLSEVPRVALAAAGSPRLRLGPVLRAASPCLSCASVVWKGKEQRQTFVSPGVLFLMRSTGRIFG